MSALSQIRGADEVRVVRLEDSAEPVTMHAFLTPVPQPHLPALVFFHGGLFNAGSIDSAYPFARALAADITVLLVEYPLAPAMRFPKTPELALRATQWVCANAAAMGARAGAVVIGGEEAGGNLAAAASMMLRDCRETCSPQVRLLGQVLISPMLDPTQSSASMRACKTFTCSQSWSDYLPDAADAMHPYAAPLHSRRLNGLPRTLVISGESSPLRDDAERYASNLSAAGIDTSVQRLPGDLQSMISPSLPSFPAVVELVRSFVTNSA